MYILTIYFDFVYFDYFLAHLKVIPRCGFFSDLLSQSQEHDSDEEKTGKLQTNLPVYKTPCK